MSISNRKIQLRGVRSTHRYYYCTIPRPPANAVLHSPHSACAIGLRSHGPCGTRAFCCKRSFSSSFTRKKFFDGRRHLPLTLLAWLLLAARGCGSKSDFTSGRLAASVRGHRRSEEHTSELQSHLKLVCRLLLE